MPGALAIVVLYLQLRLHRTQENLKKREELFQIVTENAADMIALVDVKGLKIERGFYFARLQGEAQALPELFMRFALHYQEKR